MRGNAGVERPPFPSTVVFARVVRRLLASRPEKSEGKVMPPEDSRDSRASRGATPGTAIRILAKTMFHDLLNAGYQARDVVAFATELLDLVISSLRSQGSQENPNERDR